MKASLSIFFYLLVAYEAVDGKIIEIKFHIGFLSR